MKNFVVKSGLSFLMWIIATLPMYAFPGPPDGGEDPLPPEAPIDNWMFVLVLAAVAISVYFFINKKAKQVA